MRMICPACGIQMLVPDNHTGAVLNCISCGKRIRLDEPVAGDPQGESEFDYSTMAPARQRPRQPVRQKQQWQKPLLAGCIAAVLSGIVVTLIVVFRGAATPETIEKPEPVAPAWDRQHRSELLAIKANADALAMAGKWQDSYNEYQKIITLVGEHDVKDPVSVGVVSAVRPGEERAMSALTASRAMMPSATAGAREPGVAAATAPPPAAAVASPVLPPVNMPSLSTATSQPITSSTQPAVALAGPATQATPEAVPPNEPLDPAQYIADNAPPMAGPKPPAPSLHAYTLPDLVTDQQIGEAIDNGVHFLAGQFRGGRIMGFGNGAPGVVGSVEVPKKQRPEAQPHAAMNVPSDMDSGSGLGAVPPPNAPVKPADTSFNPQSLMSEPGVDALCAYALLNAGRAQDVQGLGEQDPFTKQILEVLKRYPMDSTYHRSLRAAALAVFNRTEDNAALEEDVRWLLAASMEGAYTYGMPGPHADRSWDNSNSQYGLLGVWSGAQAGKSVPQSYWTDVEHHWTICAGQGGTWGYQMGGNTLTMTCAGIASLLVAGDYLESQKLGDPSASLASPLPLLDAGLNWLDNGDNCMAGLSSISMGGAGYGLYGLERVGLASGFKYFGRHDWYSELARQMVAEQHFDGSWGAKSLIDTSYALLFLARGRHPILFNKLRYDGDWNNRPHDASHLARFAAHSLERPLNWQVVNLRRNWFDWMDCPVLYISGEKRPKLKPEDYHALRQFAEGGGTLFTHADGGSAEFNKWVAELVRQIFPKYELTRVPADHALYSVVYQLKNPQPLQAVSNGSRLLLIHSPEDLAGGWQLNWTDEKKAAFQLGVNLFVYAAGKGNLKNRLASTYIPQDPDQAESSRRIARLQYAGEWDPEPYAWTRFRRYFQWETHQAIDPVTVQLKELQPGSVPMAVLTGTVRHDFTEDEQSAARAYVRAGGVLMIDACGGQTDFVKCVQQTLLPQAFAGASPVTIGPNHPLLLASRAHADDLNHMLLRGFANEHSGKDLPIQTMAYGKGWVIFSRLDLTTGLLGTQGWGILGFDPAYSQALMKNVVLWAEARSPAVVAPATNRS